MGVRGALKLSIRVAVLECGEQSHVAATSSSFSSSSTTFPSLLRGKSGSPEVRLSEAQSCGACRSEEVRADGAVDPAGPKGRQLMTAEASATLVVKDKGRLLVQPEPAGSRRGLRPALWSPAVQHPLPSLLLVLVVAQGGQGSCHQLLQLCSQQRVMVGDRLVHPRDPGSLADEYL